MRALAAALLAHGRLSPLAPVLPAAFASATPAATFAAWLLGTSMRALPAAVLAHGRLSPLAPLLAGAFA